MAFAPQERILHGYARWAIDFHMRPQPASSGFADDSRQAAPTLRIGRQMA